MDQTDYKENSSLEVADYEHRAMDLSMQSIPDISLETTTMTSTSTTTSPSQTKKKRRQRTVKNALVDIDHIAIQPGINYCHWITVTKRQLKEREYKLFQSQRNCCEEIVNKELHDHYKNELNLEIKPGRFRVGQSLADNSLNTLFGRVSAWNGVNIGRLRTNANINRYRDYFNLAKNWYTQIKKKIYGDLFWVPLFLQISQHVASIPSAHTLEMRIIRSLFDATVKHSNTKAIDLINGWMMMQCDAMHVYLHRLHPSLQVKQWVHQQEAAGNWKKKVKTVNVQLRRVLQSALPAAPNIDTGQSGARAPQTPVAARTLERTTHTSAPSDHDNNNSNTTLHQMVNIPNLPRLENSQGEPVPSAPLPERVASRTLLSAAAYQRTSLPPPLHTSTAICRQNVAPLAHLWPSSSSSSAAAAAALYRNVLHSSSLLDRARLMPSVGTNLSNLNFTIFNQSTGFRQTIPLLVVSCLPSATPWSMQAPVYMPYMPTSQLNPQAYTLSHVAQASVADSSMLVSHPNPAHP